MKKLCALVLLGLALLLVKMAPVNACECDCYFDYDCLSGMVCNYGNLYLEDNCWFRQPKPMQVVGAGCNEDMDAFGKCDGICTPSGSPSPFTPEDRDLLIAGFRIWGQAFHDAATNGSGVIDPMTVRAVDKLGFLDLDMSNDIGRLVIEVMLMSRGQEFIIFPQRDQWFSEEVGVQDLSRDACRLEAGELAMATLIAEIKFTGSGGEIAKGISAECLDQDLFSRICAEGEEPVACLYGRLSDLGEAVGFGGRNGMSSERGGPCQLPGDFDVDGDMDLDDAATLYACLRGPELPTTSDCTATDMTGDGHTDLKDVMAFQEVFLPEF